MKLLFLILSLILPPVVMAQEADADPYAECAAVLAGPPFVDILTRNDGNDFYKLDTESGGKKLLGLACSVDQLTEFFEGAGWEFEYFQEHRQVGTIKTFSSSFLVDFSVHYCLKHPTFLGVFDYRCRPVAIVNFHKERISFVSTYTTK